jgi:AcrR family transcriptional regulator
VTPNSPRLAPPVAEAPARRGRPSRRAPIFAAALRLFRERGFHATSINDIGDAAGVAGTAIYSHFATKHELLAEAIREGARRIREGVKEALADQARPPEAALEALVRAYVRVVLENADMNACYVLESRNLEPEVREPLLRGERGLREAAVFAVVALCVHKNRIDHEALIELATAQVLGALRSPVPESKA